MTQPFGEEAKSRESRWYKTVRNLHLFDGFIRLRQEKAEAGKPEEYEDSERLTEVENHLDAEIVSSAIKKTGISDLGGFFQPVPVGHNVKHKLLVDIDYPVLAIDSSTPGHSHLYIDKELSWSDALKVLRVLAEVGIVEPGYVAASERRGCTHLRVPWLRKISQPNGSYL